ncbi:MAG: hypothetical protein AAFX40_10835 [Cyanobacteria bacterium J06639_1]
MSESKPTEDLGAMFDRARRIAVGAAASVVESIQDEQKREENSGLLSMEFNDLAERLAAKGEVTEVEARKYVDSVVNSAQTPASESTVDVAAQTESPPSEGVTASPMSPVDVADSAADIRELTQIVQELRRDLERMREERTNA